MKKEIAQKILKDTERGYDLISAKFSETRKRFWGDLEFIKNYTHAQNKVLDYGCGNGRLLELVGDISSLEYWGVDPSEKLIEFAKAKYGSLESSSDIKARRHFQKTDSLQTTLPFDDNFFNVTHSIAAFHHFPSEKYRQDIAKELFRVTKPGGYIVITVWNIFQKKYRKNVYKNWFEKLIGKSNLDWNDCYISFTDNSGQRFQRFHHAFTKKEIKKLFEDVGFKTERCEIIEGKNIVYIGKKEKQG